MLDDTIGIVDCTMVLKEATDMEKGVDIVRRYFEECENFWLVEDYLLLFLKPWKL